MTRARYDMPASFGPSAIAPTTTVGHAMAIICSFETEPDAIAPLLPDALSVGDTAVVNVSMIHYPSTDYMGGRGYNEIVITLAARHATAAGELNGGFAPVLWVDQFGALAAGREFQGLPKLLAEITLLGDPEKGFAFRSTEYGTDLLRGSVSELAPLPSDKLDAIRKAGSAVATFGWKYIAAPGGEVDADYATVNYTRWTYDKAWTGRGSVEFLRPSAQEAPYGSRVAGALGDLPVLRWRRAFVGQGTVVIDRTMTRKLDSPVSQRP